MNIKIASLHFKADQKLENFINDKVGKLIKVHEGIIGADVILKLENCEGNENKTAEVRVKIRGNDAIASKTSASFEESVDVVVEALKKQLLKMKDKQHKKMNNKEIRKINQHNKSSDIEADDME
ncbi:MAG: ribosome-associated translation inhibitor RaiA [Bacteroidales bacterium]|jgi:putative sigma-54 modulation protein|nr:ribosome-associated translation inhibitor RaiA [Bacteroidales bacterium]